MENRKMNRLGEYDYSSNGMYFITICTKDRIPYLSEINMDIRGVGDGVLDVPKLILKNYGKIVNDQIIEMNGIYKKINVIKYVIMPDHIHMILFLFDDDRIIGGTSRTPAPTNAIIPAFVSTLKRFTNKKIGFNIWQRSFHDHIIRNKNEFSEIWQYIENNPINWANHKHNQNLWR